MKAENHRSVQAEEQRALAVRYAPIIFMDEAEPFRPEMVGYTVFRRGGPSLSFPRDIQVEPPVRHVIEYAVWWDWDIGHLYELEHVWVYVDGDGRVVKVEASWHGRYHEMKVDGRIPMEDGRPIVYAEPGKHAMAPSPEWFRRRASEVILACTRLAGAGGVWENVLYGKPEVKSPRVDRLVRTYLRRKAFMPSFRFTRKAVVSDKMLIPWKQMERIIPARLRTWVHHLSRTLSEDELSLLAIAHRGASAVAPENTLLAIRLAANMGADMVEMDVRLTADGVPVVIHDANLRRLAGRGINIADMTADELQEVQIRQGQRVPTLNEALRLCRELAIGAYLELKEPGTPIASALLVRQMDMTYHTIFSSFHADLLLEVKQVLPHAYTAILFHDVDADPLVLAEKANANYVHPAWEKAAPRPDFLLSRAWVERVHAQDLGVITWHEERPNVVRALRHLGVDGICSDRPDVITLAKSGVPLPGTQSPLWRRSKYTVVGER